MRSRSRKLGSFIKASNYVGRLNEMFMQMVDVFHESAFVMTAHGYGVEHGKVLHHFAQSDSTSMRADWNIELRREKDVGQILIYTSNSGGINLHNRNCIELK